MARRKTTTLTELRFLPTDFERFRPELQRDPIHNAARLEVRRKLESLGKHLSEALAGKKLAFTSRASLHHPFRFNSYQVNSQWVYLSRAEKERRDLKRLLGVELGKDLDQNYVHVLLVLEIHHQGLGVALRVHKDAWWDGENLKRRARHSVAGAELATALRGLPGYGLKIHDHRRIHECPSMTAAELVETMKYYTPGEHWINIHRQIPRDDPYVTEEGLLGRIENEMRILLPVYRLIRWTVDNNFLFREK